MRRRQTGAFTVEATFGIAALIMMMYFIGDLAFYCQAKPSPVRLVIPLQPPPRSDFDSSMRDTLLPKPILILLTR